MADRGFSQLDLSSKKTEKLSREFDDLLSLSRASRGQISDQINIDKEKIGELKSQARKLALESMGGFTSPDKYEEKKQESREKAKENGQFRNYIPIECKEDIDAFARWMGKETSLAARTKVKYRKVVRRFYFYTNMELEREGEITLENDGDLKQFQEELRDFVVSYNTELGMKKYISYLIDKEPENQAAAEQVKDLIDKIDYENQERLDFSIADAIDRKRDQ